MYAPGTADVSDPTQVKALFDAGIAHFGKLGVLVNNAGIMITKLLKDTTDEDFTRQFEMNVRGINVNAVLPGPTDTELFPKGKSQELIDRLASLNAFNRLGQPHDIAKTVAFLASDDAK